ncbi:MAG: DUF5710 domain-containing protein [Fusobacteriaceae bacterium]|nr:DUF5710 domain-containing protein [Fusobacteriaceae bacterium]
MSAKKILFFDTETNGLFHCSVLSFSAYVVRMDPETLDCEIQEKINRFYFPREKWDFGAAKVHGLTRDVVTEKRRGVSYPEYFAGDPFIRETIEGCDFFIAHNIAFDESFLPLPLRQETKFDTMDYCASILAVPSSKGKRAFKPPKLKECAAFFKIPLDEDSLHESIYDVEMMFLVFMSLLQDPVYREDIRNWLTGARYRDYLKVPYAEKEEAKALGARWDAEKKKWYAPYAKDRHKFEKWR